MNTKPIISVVIPTVGRPSLLRTVQSLLKANRSSEIEIIVAGTFANRATAEQFASLAAQNPNIVHLPVAFTRGDSSEKKNAGWRAAHAEIIAFIDDDVVVGMDWPEAVLKTFKDDSTGLMSGPGLVPDDIPLMARLAGWTLASCAAGYVQERYLTGHRGPVSVGWSRLIGCNMAYRRKVLEEIGGFDPKFWPGEEMLAAYLATVRKGHRLVFQPSAVLHHYPRAGFVQFMKQMYGYGATRIRLIRAGTSLELLTLAPMAMVAIFLLLVGAALFFPVVFAPLLLIGALLYAFFACWCAAAKWRDVKDARALLIFFMIPAMHFSYGMAQWIELLRPDRDLSLRQNSNAADVSGEPPHANGSV